MYEHAMNVKLDSSKDIVKLVRRSAVANGKTPVLPSERA